eukprot:TRINITY_DN1902_c0_g1_i4.p1 TRINITY_DN1902_c0_g1~~TRINITY_DN1902_c0_g1_i4.p1  ORF type:complete len:231 (-),score=54.97 TRINITY_DN1902_c0_g1_i4:34-726(-)
MSDNETLFIEAPEVPSALLLDRKGELTGDTGNLSGWSYHPIDVDAFKKQGASDYLLSSGRDSTQLLFNSIFSCPTTRTQDGHVLADLPTPTTRIPREKPIPKARPPTRWETFAQKKGIQPKQKRSKMIFDEASGEWKRRHGYDRANNPLETEIIKVVNPNDPDPFADPFAKARQDKRQRVKDQTKRELRNKREASNAAAKELGVSAGAGVGRKGSVKQLSNAIDLSLIHI